MYMSKVTPDGRRIKTIQFYGETHEEELELERLGDPDEISEHEDRQVDWNKYFKKETQTMTKKGKKDPRFTFTLPHQQLEALRQIAEDAGLAVADHIRRAITGYLRKMKLEYKDSDHEIDRFGKRAITDYLRKEEEKS